MNSVYHTWRVKREPWRPFIEWEKLGGNKRAARREQQKQILIFWRFSKCSSSPWILWKHRTSLFMKTCWLASYVAKTRSSKTAPECSSDVPLLAILWYANEKTSSPKLTKTHNVMHTCGHIESHPRSLTNFWSRDQCTKRLQFSRDHQLPIGPQSSHVQCPRKHISSTTVMLVT